MSDSTFVPQISTILWPTDLSPGSQAASAYVDMLAARFDAQVHLLYVAQDFKEYDHIYGDANAKALVKMQEKERARIEEKINKICQEDLSACPVQIKHIVSGDPAREILEAAESLKVDLIIMATQGWGDENKEPRFFGSTTEKVVRNAKIPVFTIKPG
jgi:nucleotide-binding universal stress UspA family protein